MNHKSNSGQRYPASSRQKVLPVSEHPSRTSRKEPPQKTQPVTQNTGKQKGKKLNLPPGNDTHFNQSPQLWTGSSESQNNISAPSYSDSSASIDSKGIPRHSGHGNPHIKVRFLTSQDIDKNRYEEMDETTEQSNNNSEFRHEFPNYVYPPDEIIKQLENKFDYNIMSVLSTEEELSPPNIDENVVNSVMNDAFQKELDRYLKCV